jgi:hypothetical protein
VSRIAITTSRTQISPIGMARSFREIAEIKRNCLAKDAGSEALARVWPPDRSSR